MIIIQIIVKILLSILVSFIFINGVRILICLAKLVFGEEL